MTSLTPLDPAETLAVAAEALGTALEGLEDLGGSERSLVLRARIAADPSTDRPDPAPAPDTTAVVKRFRLRQGRAPEGYARERFGLAHLDHTPVLLASDDAHALLVMSDLGTGDSLADLLLGTDSAAAHEGACQWAAALGDLAGASVTAAIGSQEELEAARGDVEHADVVRAGLRDLQEWVGATEAGDDERTESELCEFLALLTAPDELVLWPGDACPDNALRPAEDRDGWAFLDLESTSAAHPALVTAYPILPFATCWCALDPPAGFTDELREAFTRALAVHLPRVVAEPGWSRSVDAGCAIWILTMSTWMIPRARTGDGPIGPPGRPSPTRRQHLTARWDWAGAHLACTFPALAALARRAADVARDRWGQDAGSPGPYPAFG